MPSWYTRHPMPWLWSWFQMVVMPEISPARIESVPDFPAVVPLASAR